MKFAQVLALLPVAVQAFPAAFEPEVLEKMPQVKSPLKRDLEAGKDPVSVSKGETNCGPTPCLHFNEKDQKVSITGPYAYQSPAISDIRGPCPGLNAAANHGYLPRSGIASIEETVSGLGALYNMQPELAVFLATYAIALDGNIVEGVWSIGGPLPPDPEFSGLIGTGQGLSYSHNNYEGDSSIGRNDAYLDHGNAHSLNVTRFTEVYHTGGKEDRYTLDKFRQHLIKNQDYSIKYNPYYFTGAFSTIVVVPAAYNFVINFMSNHSAEEPSGYLNGYNFKSFFAISGEPGNFKWNKGQERVPPNWYRRPTSNQYTANDVGEDVAIGYLAYPKTLKIGGNTGKPNSYVGVSVQQLTGGSLNEKSLFEGDNFQCFAFNLAQQAIPDFLKGPLDKLNNASDFLSGAITPITSKLNCPQLGKADQGLFNAYPGKTYNPKGKDTNY